MSANGDHSIAINEKNRGHTWRQRPLNTKALLRNQSGRRDFLCARSSSAGGRHAALQLLEPALHEDESVFNVKRSLVDRSAARLRIAG